MARGPHRVDTVVQAQYNVNLGAANGDVALTLCVPGDNARVIDVSFTVETAGVGATANNLVTLEAGTGAAGAAIASQATVDSDSVTGTTVLVKGSPAAGLLRGVHLQLQNVEAVADVTTGPLVNVVILWQL